MLKPELLPGISKAVGYKGSYLLRRAIGVEVEFITIMIWDSIDAIRAVAGRDYETAVIPEERRKYLARYDSKSTHYEIASIQGLGVASNGPADLYIASLFYNRRAGEECHESRHPNETRCYRRPTA
jgi:hypothetical protein